MKPKGRTKSGKGRRETRKKPKTETKKGKPLTGREGTRGKGGAAERDGKLRQETQRT